MNRLSASERYETDPLFRALVQMFEVHLSRGDYTPSELREAVILAASHIEMRKPVGWVWEIELDVIEEVMRGC